jgi:acyl dehydratase
VEFLNWRRPVLAGDTISLMMTVQAKRPSKSRPNLGLVTVRQDLSNQRGERVCEMVSTVMFLKRNGGEDR